ncbi:hypothetical protein [Arthrobacter sp. ES3-54]|uniref:hypothetical protein n=1 Tax=Arthrobacter sp. ES3-54 TaxID=1502991 RepID=UPI0032175093
MESCAECRARQQRERQYLEKLRGAAVPEASEDLTARLLARTGQLAAERAAAERTSPAELEAPERAAPEPADAADTAATEQAGTHRWLPGQFPAADSLPDRTATAGTAAANIAAHPQRRGGPRLPVLAVGGAVAALAFMTGTAYVMGGDDAVPVDGAGASALAQPDAAGPPASGEPVGAGELFDAGGSGGPGAEETGPRVAFGLGGEPDFTPAGTLSTGQLAAFRSQGWTCPELHALGFHLMWARAGVIAGDEVLELRLTDGQHFATVLEQHAAARGPGSAPTPAGAEVSPINVLTGHAAVADGFTRAKGGTRSAAPETGNGTLWVNPAPPYRAIYQTSAATYTYISDLPAEQADDGAAALTRVSGGAPVQGSRNGIPERIERGLSRILEHLAP